MHPLPALLAGCARSVPGNLRLGRLPGATLAALLLAVSAPAQTAPAAAPTPAAGPAVDSSIVTLSPFTVTGEAEQGYLATQTLVGTRLKASVRDVGAALTIFTDQIMDDLAASSVLDLVNFAPNTDSYVGNLSDTTGAGNEFLTNQTPQYVTRGGTTGLISQDFFGTPSVPPDRYNAENFTFTRGPNAILFGLGNAAGAFTSLTKRARFQPRFNIELRGDDEGGLRATADLNHVLLPGRLALRYAGLHEDSRGFRDPSDGEQRRHFLTATFTPFRRTSLRASVETGRVHTLAVRPWPVYDGLTPWIDAGRPMVAVRGQALRPGLENAYGAAQNLLVMELTPAGIVVPPMRWQNQRRSANPAFPQYPNLATRRSLVRPDLFPVTANVIGHGSSRELEFDSFSATWEQQFSRDLFVEASLSHVLSDNLVSAAFNGLNDRVYVDVNQQLPNGAPNPNAGLYYVDSNMNILPNRYKNTTGRLMLAYELDAARWNSRLGPWLGRHRLAGLLEDSETGVWGSQNPSQNLTPLPGDPASLANVNSNRVLFRYYLDPARGVTSAGINGAARYPLMFAGSPLPPAHPSGVTPGLAAIFGGTAADTRIITQMIATQSHFWRDRLAVTFGLRRDRQITHRGQQADFAPWADARGLYPNPRDFDARRHFPASRIDEAGRTYTRGLVFHALPWLSLSYNASNSLQPNSTVRDVAGNLLPANEGEGQDYGLKFALLQGRLVADVVYYKNFSRNRPDRAVANGIHGNFQNDINAIWSTVAALENDSKYEAQPYAFTGSNWQDVNTGYSDGVETSLTANLTARWRLTVNASKRGPGETQARGALLRSYLAQHLPQWRGNSRWMSAPLVSGAQGGTVADAVARIENTLASFDALAELPSDSLLSSEWSANLVTSYSFAPDSRLRRFSVGASANLRGKTVIGFAEDARQVLIAGRPYHADETVATGAWITFRHRFSRPRIDCRVQLNIRNLLDEDLLVPNRAVDRRDGSGAGEVVIHRLNAPRTFLLTTSFTY